jgi:hypothetical protein
MCDVLSMESARDPTAWLIGGFIVIAAMALIDWLRHMRRR